MSSPTITIIRWREYHRGQTGPAWTYVYQVTIPEEKYAFVGAPLSWARNLAKRKRPDLPVVEKWDHGSRRS